MATVGFNVSEDVKQDVDKAVSEFISTNGGKKSDFVPAVLDAWRTLQAKSALPGRQEEIDRFESLVAALRQSYLYSLSVADSAIRDKADATSEIDAIRNKAKQRDLDTVALREEIVNLKNALAAAQQAQAKAEQDKDKALAAFLEERQEMKGKAAMADKYAADLAQYRAQVSNLNAQLSAMDKLLTPKQREKLSLNNVVNDG